MTERQLKTRPRNRVIVNKKIAPYLFLAPFALLFVAFLIVPLIYAADISLYKKAMVGGVKFVGADNYIKAFADPKFWEGIGVLFKFAFLQIPIMIGTALLFALILDSGVLWAKAFFRISFFIPYAVPAVIATLIWSYLYGPAYGPIGQTARLLGFEAPDFVSQEWILGSIVNIAQWQFMGYNMIIYFAALQAIPGDLEEASVVDGASAFTFATRIKLPMIVPTIIVTVVFSIIGSLQLFTEPFLIQNMARSVINSNFTPNIYAYNLTFVAQQPNYAAAISFLLGGVIAVVSYVFMLATNQRIDR
jgi:multiple sugar transport system permease protein